MKISITLKYLQHKQQNCIAVYYKTNTALNNLIKQIEGCRWSQTHQCWLLPFNQPTLIQLQTQLGPLATIHETALTQTGKRTNNNTTTVPAYIKLPNSIKQFAKIHEVNKEV